MKPKKKETIIVFGAHSDDQIIPIGGTIAKYTKEGKEVITVIFTEGGITTLKDKLYMNIRKKEALKADKVIGVKKTIFLKIPELRMVKEAKNPKLIEKVKSIINKYKPDKIFTHTIYDVHHDHRAVHKIVTKAVDEIKGKKYHVYTFDVWDVAKTLNLLRKDGPKLFVDISKTFDKKIKAINLFKSQKFYTYQLLPYVYINAITNGKKNNCKYAEMFYKIR